MGDTAQVLIQIRGDVGDINAKLTDLRGNIGRVAAQSGALSQNMNSAFGTLKGVFAAALGALSVRALADIVSQAAEAGDAMVKMAEKTGISVESLSALKYAAALSDVEMGKVQVGVSKLSRAMYDAAAGVEKTQSVFKTLGLAYQDSNGKLRDTGDMMIDIGAKFSQMENGATKAALAQKLFGKSGTELLPLLNHLEELAAEARSLGYIMSEESAGALEEFNDSMKRIKLGSEALKNEFVAGLAPALTDIANAFIEARQEGMNFSDWTETVGDWIKSLAEGLYDVISLLKIAKLYLTNNFHDATIEIEKLNAQAKAFKEGLWGENQAPPKDREKPGTFTPSIAPAESKGAESQWAKMLIDMRADTDKLGVGTSEWEKKIIDVNNRYDEYIAKLIAMKMNDSQHLAIINDYRDQVLGLISQEREWVVLNKQRLDDMREESVEMENHVTLNKAKIGVESLLAAARLSLLASRGQDVDLQKLELDYETKTKELRLEIAKIADEMTRADTEAWEKLLAQKTALEMQLPILKEILDINKKIKDESELNRLDVTAGMMKGLQDLSREWESLGTFMGDSVIRAFKGMEDALVDFVKTGKLNFSSLVNSMISDLARLMIRQTITAPLAAGLLGTLSGIGGGGLIPGVGQLDVSGGDTLFASHSGGIVGSEGTRRSYRIGINPGLLPRYHAGIGPDEQLTVLQKGEGVFTAGQMRALGSALGGGGGMSINVPVTIEGGGKKLASDLRRNIERTVEDTVRRHM